MQLSYRAYRFAANLPLLLLIVFFLVGGAIKWEILLPGLAWRTWLLLFVLPAVITIWEMGSVIRKQDATGDIAGER